MVICQRNVNNTISKLQFLPRFVWYISYGNWLPSGNRSFELFPFNPLFNNVRKYYVAVSASSGDLSSVRWPCNFVDASCSWFVQRMGPTWKVSMAQQMSCIWKFYNFSLNLRKKLCRNFAIILAFCQRFIIIRYTKIANFFRLAASFLLFYFAYQSYHKVSMCWRIQQQKVVHPETMKPKWLDNHVG